MRLKKLAASSERILRVDTLAPAISENHFTNLIVDVVCIVASARSSFLDYLCSNEQNQRTHEYEE